MIKGAIALIVSLVAAVALSAQPAPNYRVDSLGQGLWRIQAVAGTLSTAYLVAGTRDAVLIDTCTGQAGLKAVVDGLIGNRRLLVALTHGHGDHSGGIRYFPEVLVHPADAGLLPKDATTVRRDLNDGDVMGNRGGRQTTYGSAILVFNPDRLR